MNDEYNRVNIGHISTKVFPFSLVKIPVAEGRGGDLHSFSEIHLSQPN